MGRLGRRSLESGWPGPSPGWGTAGRAPLPAHRHLQDPERRHVPASEGNKNFRSDLDALALNRRLGHRLAGINPAFSHIDVASALLGQGEPEEAARRGSDVLSLPRAQVIDPIVQRTNALYEALAPHLALPAVRDLGERLRAVGARPALGT